MASTAVLPTLAGLWRAAQQWLRRATTFLTQPQVRASYFDAANSSAWNARHWQHVTAQDADACMSSATRLAIARRARLEVANNPLARGLVDAHAAYTCGLGPTLRVQTRSPGFNQIIELRFWQWATEVGLPSLLRTAVMARVVDGEVFAVFKPRRLRNPVGLGIELIEADQVTFGALPQISTSDQRFRVDGIEFDADDNIVAYYILPAHPGASAAASLQRPQRVPADKVCHLFIPTRPGQHRGLSQLAPSLTTLAALRRYREAMLMAAENLAAISVLLKTQNAPTDEAELASPFSTFPLEKGTIMALPEGYDAYQPRPEQPPATYADYMRGEICQVTRVLGQPYNIALGDSSGYSFSGGRLDHLTYWTRIDVERSVLESQFLDRVFAYWWYLATDAYDITYEYDIPQHTWDWPKHPTIDELKETSSREVALRNGITSLTRVYSEDGKDFADEVATMAADYGVDVTTMKRILLMSHYGKAVEALQNVGFPASSPTERNEG